MAVPAVIRWDDAGAPILNNTLGSLIAVLDFCLLTRGWDKVFSGTNVAVYRAQTGNRKFYKIVDNNTTESNSFYSATITGYDSMSDVNTGAGWGQTRYIRKSYNDTTQKRWLCIVDAKGFMIATQPHGGTAVGIALRVFVPHYIGETIPVLPGQTSRDVIAACTNSGYYNSMLGTVGSTSYTAACNRSIDGTASNVEILVSRTCIPLGNTDAFSPPGNFNSALYSYPYNGELLYCKDCMSDTIHTGTIGDYLPWIYHTAQKGSGFVNAGAISADGKTFIGLYISTAYTYSGGTYGNIAEVVTTGQTYWGVLLFCISDSR